MAEDNSTNHALFPVLLPCSKCKEHKPIDEFRRRPGRSARGKRWGRWSHCIACERLLAKTPHGRAIANKSTAAFRMRLKSNNYEEYRRRERQQNFRRNYGIEIDDYDAMLVAQGGKCAICDGPPAGCRWERDAYTGEKRVQRFSVDHDHETGAVRKLLCGRCNRGLGDFRDSPQLLLKAAEYLTSHGRS